MTTKPTAMTTEELADEVQRGRRSRTSIRREFGNRVYTEVQAMLRERDARQREIARSAPPEPEDEPTDGDDPRFCEDCDEFLGTDDPDVTRCERCQKSADFWTWLETTVEEVAAIADAAGWHFDGSDYSGGVNTLSRYYTLERDLPDGEVETLKLRISDHGSLYCSEDISLAMHPGGDDHDLTGLKARLDRLDRDPKRKETPP